MSKNVQGSRGLSENSEFLIYSGVALGLLAGTAISTYIWRQRIKLAESANVSPLEKAEQLIAACEKKLDSIEKSMKELQDEKK